MTQQQESPYERLNPLNLKECIQKRTGEPAALQTEAAAAYGFRVSNKGNRTCFVRFFGPPGEEEQKLNRYADALRRDGYEVAYKEENSLTPNSLKRQREQKERRNRRFLVVKKRKRTQRQRQISRGGSRAR